MKKIITWSFLAVLAIAAALVGASHALLNYALQPESTSRDLPATYGRLYCDYPFLEPWVDSLNAAGAFRDTFIVHRNLRLHAYYVPAPSPSKATAVIIHGYGDNAIGMFMIAHLYNQRMGYNVLLPDLQNSGLSSGNTFQMGWHDSRDVMKWMDVANALFGGSTQMVVHGISMGAATTMMLSGEPQKPYVKCFVEDCGYTSVWDEFSHEMRKRFGLPDFPLLHIANWLCGIERRWTFKQASALEQVKKCTLPMLFIHGTVDDFVPTWMVYELFDAKPSPKDIWVAPASAHALSYKENMQEYLWRVKNFTSKYIDGN